MKLTKNKKYLQQKISRKVLVPLTTADLTSRVSKSCVPFTCKFPMVMHFVPILHRWCLSKTNFHIFSYDKTSLKFCACFKFFLAVFMEKIQKIHYLNHVRRGIGYHMCGTFQTRYTKNRYKNMNNILGVPLMLGGVEHFRQLVYFGSARSESGHIFPVMVQLYGWLTLKSNIKVSLLWIYPFLIYVICVIR